MRRGPRSSQYSPPPGGADFDSLVEPQGIPDLVAWHRSDFGTLVSGKYSVLEDRATARAHPLSQGTAANRAVQAIDLATGLSYLDFNGSDLFMTWTDWAGPAKCSIVAVVKYKTTTALQVMLYQNSQATPYLGGNGTTGAQNKPFHYTNNPFAQWGTALVDGQKYAIEWTTDADTETCITRVDDDAQVSEVSGAAFAPGTFKTLGFDPALVSTQDLISGLFELRIYSHKLTAPERARWLSYVAARYQVPGLL